MTNMDELSLRLREEALAVEQKEPELKMLLRQTILAEENATFEDAVASTVCYRLLLRPCAQQPSSMDDMNNNNSMFCPHALRCLIRKCMDSPLEELGHTMSYAIRQDALAVVERDPAVNKVLEVVLFSKGYAAMVCHRAAFRLWHEMDRTYTALFLQSQASAVFGVDIHPKTQMGCSIMLDHGTGIVIGETATVGDGCTMLHGVTLGGTGKEGGDRHPKVGRNTLIGAGTSILGNIKVGEGAKIGAGSVVLRPIPPHATAVGAPAKVIGRAKEENPGSTMDDTLQNVAMFHKSASSATLSTLGTTTSTETAKSTEIQEPSKNIIHTNQNDATNKPGEVKDKEEDKYRQKSQNDSPSENDGLAANNEKEFQNKSQYDAPKEISDDYSISSGSDSGSGNSDSCFCPFRDYIKLAKTAPPDSITICQLAKLLLPLGCKKTDVHACFFELDTKNVGYVKKAVFRENALSAIVSNTLLDEATARILIEEALV